VQAKASRFSTKGYTATKVAIVVGTVAYAVVADLGGRLSARGEFFPVFNWSLFTYVDAYPLLAELHVISIGDKRFDKPINYFQLGSYYDAARRRSSGVSKAVVRLHIALRLKDAAQVTRMRKVIEKGYLSGHGPVEYEIRSVRFNPIERWKNKAYVADHTVMARFKTEDAP
jgi:hypothetical protein